jgi:hypothetical protein
MEMMVVVLAIGALLCFLVWGLTGKLAVWARVLTRTFFIALVVSPSLLIGAGEGGGGIIPVPALFVFAVSALDRNWKWFFKGFVLPVLGVWCLIYSISMIYVRVRSLHANEHAVPPPDAGTGPKPS